MEELRDTYLELAKYALAPYIAVIVSEDVKTSLYQEWASWFRRNGVEDALQARELVAASILKRVTTTDIVLAAVLDSSIDTRKATG